MTLSLRGLKVTCVIGDHPDERNRPQTLSLDLDLTISSRAAQTDVLADTIDYGKLARQIREALVAARCHLIEHAAQVVAQVVKADPRVLSGRVSVAKAQPIPALQFAVATLDF